MNRAQACDEIDSLLQEARDLAREHGLDETVSAIRWAQDRVQEELEAVPATARREAVIGSIAKCHQCQLSIVEGESYTVLDGFTHHSHDKCIERLTAKVAELEAALKELATTTGTEDGGAITSGGHSPAALAQSALAVS